MHVTFVTDAGLLTASVHVLQPNRLIIISPGLAEKCDRPDEASGALAEIDCAGRDFKGRTSVKKGENARIYT